MLFTVSTVKETVDGLDRFVRRNLAGGVDHLVVFIEDPEPDATTWLAAHQHVTAIATDDAWWGDRRPPQLNARQKINANLARSLLTCVPQAEWLWHLDGDEVLQADRAALDQIPPSVGVAHAAPLEAVSQESWPGSRVTWFKRLLDEDDLVLLKVLGVLDRPANEDYFHGHVKGKSGLRPSLDRWFTLHEVTDDQESDLPASEEPVASLLHYESWSGEEFVRKWTNILASGHLPAMRGNRQATAVALRTLGGRGLPPETLRAMLTRIYRRTTQDDLDTLRDLGLLVELDPDVGGHRPEPLPDDARHRLDAMITAFAGLDKRPLRAGESAAAAHDLLGRVAAALPAAGLGADEADRVASVWSGQAQWSETGRGDLSPSARTRGWPWPRGDR